MERKFDRLDRVARTGKLHQDGLCYRQIAEQTGKSIGTVKATLSQARKTRAR
jgi:DNA-directed RNA polymerase specialized sigma24 family protein